MKKKKKPQAFNTSRTPTNMLERIFEKAAKDPAHHGEMFRMLLDSELVLLAPADQPLVRDGATKFNTDDPLVVPSFSDDRGPFYAVFTSRKAARLAALRLPDPQAYVSVELSARIALALVYDGQTPVRVLSQGPARFVLQPEAIVQLLNGTLTGASPDDGEERQLHLNPVDPESLPPEMTGAIRNFCGMRPDALGVYAFLRTIPETGGMDDTTIFVVLWLRGADPSFYNDFGLMIQRSTGQYQIVISVADEETFELLRQSPPVWPVVSDDSASD